jgi:hypothetical protein
MKVGDRVAYVGKSPRYLYKEGGVEDVSPSGAVCVVRFDGEQFTCIIFTSELTLISVMQASHYQPVAGVPDSVPVLDDGADEIDTSITADVAEEQEEPDYLSITRSFCR